MFRGFVLFFSFPYRLVSEVVDLADEVDLPAFDGRDVVRQLAVEAGARVPRVGHVLLVVVVVVGRRVHVDGGGPRQARGRRGPRARVAHRHQAWKTTITMRRGSLNKRKGIILIVTTSDAKTLILQPNQ